MWRATSSIAGMATLALFVLLSTACSGGSAQDPKPVKEYPLITEFRAPPPTQNEMILAADAVVVGQIAGSRPNDQEYGGRPMVKTVWTLKVREVLHFNGTGSLPDEIFIEREGGERDRGSHVERVIQPQYPAFQVGQEYVLFLRKAGDSMWWSAFGPSSAYRLSRGRVEALGSSRIAVSQNGETEEAFLQTIRNVGIK